MSIENLNDLSNDLRAIERNFKEKIEPYRSDLWKYCYKLTGSPWDTEDLVQETLLRSLSVLAKLFQPVNTKAYLFKIATNLWIDQKRKEKHYILPLNEPFVEDNNSIEDLQLMENLEVLVQQLTTRQYVALILADVFQFKGKEIALIVGTTEAAVHTSLSRARNTLLNNSKNITGGKLNTKTLNREIHTNYAINILLEGFRKKDPGLIASILDENIVTNITHSGIEIGLSETKKNSLKDWKEIVQQQQVIVAEYIELWGRSVIVEMEKKQDNKLYLNNIHYFEIEEDKVTYWKFYCFSWDLMKSAAKELDINLNAEYFYKIF